MRFRVRKSLRLLRPAGLALSAAVAAALLLDLPLSHLAPHGYRWKNVPLPGDAPAKVIDTWSWVVTADHGVACVTMDAQTGPVSEIVFSTLPVGWLLHGEVPPYRFRRTIGFFFDTYRRRTPWGVRSSFAVAMPHWALAVISALPCLPRLLRTIRKRGTAPGGFPLESPAASPPPPAATPLPVRAA